MDDNEEENNTNKETNNEIPKRKKKNTSIKKKHTPLKKKIQPNQSLHKHNSSSNSSESNMVDNEEENNANKETNNEIPKGKNNVSKNGICIKSSTSLFNQTETSSIPTLICFREGIFFIECIKNAFFLQNAMKIEATSKNYNKIDLENIIDSDYKKMLNSPIFNINEIVGFFCRYYNEKEWEISQIESKDWLDLFAKSKKHLKEFFYYDIYSDKGSDKDIETRPSIKSLKESFHISDGSTYEFMWAYAMRIPKDNKMETGIRSSLSSSINNYLIVKYPDRNEYICFGDGYVRYMDKAPKNDIAILTAYRKRLL